jgi:hypothetical protein
MHTSSRSPMQETERSKIQHSQSRFSVPIKATFELNARVVRLENSEASPGCPDCNKFLSLHQPDENVPTQLLGTCESCSRWFLLIDFEDVWSEFLVFDLPCEAMVREIFKGIEVSE